MQHTEQNLDHMHHDAEVKGEAVLLEIQDLSISFKQYTRGLRHRILQMTDQLNLAIHKGEVVAVIGASGAGKSLLAGAILGILPQNATMTGSINYKGEALNAEKTARLRGKDIVLIPQSIKSLNPLMKIGKQVSIVNNKNKEATVKVRKIFSGLHLPPEIESKYPFQLSGGMARRVLVAAAMNTEAQLVIADEPTAGLDEETLDETMGYIRQLADQGRGVMLITHDIESALNIADRIAVFYGGTVVEMAHSSDFTGKGEKLRHPYTKALWNALPKNEFTMVAGIQSFANSTFKR